MLRSMYRSNVLSTSVHSTSASASWRTDLGEDMPNRYLASAGMSVSYDYCYQHHRIGQRKCVSPPLLSSLYGCCSVVYLHPDFRQHSKCSVSFIQACAGVAITTCV